MLITAIIGLLFGFIGSMPVAGPIAVIVFARGVEGRFRSGLAVALGGALAEAGFAFLAFWGFSRFLAQYPWVLPASRGVAALVLTILGITFIRRRETEKEAPPGDEGIWGSFALGFTITALNPTLIATWTAAATTLFSTGLVTFAPAMAFPFALGAVVGIAGWFAILLYLVRRFRGRFSQQTLNRVIKVFGFFLLGIGLWFFVYFVRSI